MISENYIQIRAYVHSLKYFPAILPDNKPVDPTIRQPKNTKSMLIMTVRARGPFNNKYNQYFDCIGYGAFADLVHGSFQERDMVVVQGEPFVRIHSKTTRGGVIKHYQIFMHRVFPCLATGAWSRILKMDLDGKFTVDTICDEEVLGI